MIDWLRHLRTPALAGFFATLGLLISGCASPQMEALKNTWPTDLAPRAELHHVPFFAQEDYECGPAALAMVASAAGVEVQPDALVEQVYLPGRKGSLQQEMLAATRRQGLVAYPLASDLEGVLREVAAGSPVLVFQNLSLPLYPVWHYAVVIGYDRDRNTVIMHSGRTPHMEMSLFAFERTWSRAGQWAMVAVPPAQLPAHASAANYAGALAALERVHPTAAHTSYATALQKWPRERALQLGLGNTAYALGRPDEAVATFRSAVREDPGFADAWNNLAQLLWEQGQHAQAHYAITRAVKIGGPRLQHYTELQTLIHTRASQ